MAYRRPDVRVKTPNFPVVPVENIGFKRQTVSFFDRNPALDLPSVGHQ